MIWLKSELLFWQYNRTRTNRERDRRNFHTIAADRFDGLQSFTHGPGCIEGRENGKLVRQSTWKQGKLLHTRHRWSFTWLSTFLGVRRHETMAQLLLQQQLQRTH